MLGSVGERFSPHITRTADRPIVKNFRGSAILHEKRRDEKGRAARAAFVKQSNFRLLMLHGVLDRERPLARLIVNAENRVLIQGLEELRLEGGRVTALVVEN